MIYEYLLSVLSYFMPGSIYTSLKSLTFNHTFNSFFRWRILALILMASNKLSTLMAKATLPIITYLLLKTIVFKSKSVNLINLRNALSKRHHTQVLVLNHICSKNFELTFLTYFKKIVKFSDSK